VILSWSSPCISITEVVRTFRLSFSSLQLRIQLRILVVRQSTRVLKLLYLCCDIVLSSPFIPGEELKSNLLSHFG
jgi:hypothetical protein